MAGGYRIGIRTMLPDQGYGRYYEVPSMFTGPLQPGQVGFGTPSVEQSRKLYKKHAKKYRKARQAVRDTSFFSTPTFMAKGRARNEQKKASFWKRVWMFQKKYGADRGWTYARNPKYKLSAAE